MLNYIYIYITDKDMKFEDQYSLRCLTIGPYKISINEK